MMWIHYRTSDGSIVGWENSTNHDVSILGVASVNLIVDLPPNPQTQKIDLTSFQLVDMSIEEIAIANAPTMIEIKQLVAIELSSSDTYLQVPDFPMPEKEKADWLVYRRCVRDISKNGLTPSEIAAQWPPRPDGVDVSAALRDRLG